MPQLILSSNSPRRQQLLRDAGFNFDIFTRDFEEHFPDSLSATEVAEYLAKEKNHHYRSLLNDEVIITADTTVVLRDKVMNKPANRDEAIQMIEALSDQTHLVVSGVCISSKDQTESFSDTTRVSFYPITNSEIMHYVDKYRPFDKAGAYGIQEWIGLTHVKEISGSYFNVVGLPVSRVYHVLKETFHIIPGS